VKRKKKKKHNTKHQVQGLQKVQSFGKHFGVIPSKSYAGCGTQAEALI
jgi:hypothetical protein